MSKNRPRKKRDKIFFMLDGRVCSKGWFDWMTDREEKNIGGKIAPLTPQVVSLKTIVEEDGSFCQDLFQSSYSPASGASILPLIQTGLDEGSRRLSCPEQERRSTSPPFT